MKFVPIFYIITITIMFISNMWAINQAKKQLRINMRTIETLDMLQKTNSIDPFAVRELLRALDPDLK